ncbi:hypothetical protein Xant_07695 [Xanthomonas cissicola]|uniref:Secreted protein n=1 Tax=Xanthomonas cissicola TaxID=86186 RepID=A0ABX3LYP4_9XANT|nr:hypothetical protein Xant_07695 [Xanthomonas cissicola]
MCERQKGRLRAAFLVVGAWQLALIRPSGTFSRRREKGVASAGVSVVVIGATTVQHQQKQKQKQK